MRRERNETNPVEGLSSRAVHAGTPERRPDAPVVSPIVPSATFYNAPGPDGHGRYTRNGTNPNHRILNRKVAALEGAEAALVTGSGMAATSLSLLAVLTPGDRVLASRDLYGQTRRLLVEELSRFRIETTFVDPGESWEEALHPDTRAIFVEAISNPTVRVCDTEAVARVARRAGVPVLVDATFASPVNLRPLEHGADVVIHSATKYLGGHSDLIAGAVAGSSEFIASVAEKLKIFGPNLDPQAAWLLERGLKTLDVRVSRQNENALALARWLSGHPAVERVHYPGLEDHPDHERASDILDGYGGMLGVVVRGDDDAAVRILKRLRMICVAPSLGGVETLASVPRYTSHVALSREERHELGIPDGFIRMSVGIEDLADLRADLDRALAPEAR